MSESLGDIAALIRATFIAEHRYYAEARTGETSHYRPGPTFDGGTDARGAVHTAIWPRVAQFVIEHRLDPVRYVRCRWQAWFFGGRRHPLTPRQLLESASLKIYHQENKARREEIETALSLQRRAAHTAACVERAVSDEPAQQVWEAVLYDETIEMGPLFRYCLARQLGRDYRKVCRAYRAEASTQYLRDQGLYDEIWGEFIPRGFIQWAERRYRRYRRDQAMDGEDFDD